MLRPIDLARAAGISTQTVRGYERMGFLPQASRSPSGYRRYERRHLRALLASRTMVAGYGWSFTRLIMRMVHAGDINRAMELVNLRHAELHAERVGVEATLAALREVTGRAGQPGTPRDGDAVRPGDPKRPKRIREAAALVGVDVSTLRFWEQEGLLQPQRDRDNAYRLYDDEQIRRLRVVVLLRGAGYGIEAVRPVLAELAGGEPERAVTLAEERLRDLEKAVTRCVAATAAFWGYLSEQPGATAAGLL